MMAKTWWMFCLLLLFLPAVTFAEENITRVSEDDALQEVLDTAADGEIILLEDGEHHGNFVIKSSIVLKGEGDDAWLKGPDTGYTLTIEANDVTVENLNVEGGSTDGAGIFSRGDRNEIKDNRINNVFHGVLVKEGYGNIITGNIISSWDELKGSMRYGYGIYVIEGDGAIVMYNQTYDTQDGVWISHSNLAQVSYNRFIRARYGVHTMYAENIAITHNEVRGSHNGGMLMNSKNLTVKHNIFHLNITSDGAGVFGYDLFDSTFSDNIMRGNSRGVRLGYAQGNKFYQNDITENVRGVELGEGALNNTFYSNNFTKNTQQVVTNPENENDFNFLQIGNYWDDQQKLDLEANGLNDFAYKSGDVFYQMIEREPFLQIFFDSPTVRLWNTIEQYTHIPSDTHVIDGYALTEPVDVSQQIEIYVPEGEQMGFAKPAFMLCLFLSVIAIGFITLFLTRRRKL